MEILEKMLKGWQLIWQLLLPYIRIENFLFFIALLVMIAYIFNQVRYNHKKNRFTIYKNRVTMGKKIFRYLKRYRLLRHSMVRIAEKISMMNEYSMDKNMEMAAVFIVATAGVTVLLLALTVPSGMVVWYVVLVYMALMILFVLLVFYVFFTFAKMRFTSKLPEAFKILNARYISKGNIVKAIHVSLDDFDKAIKKEMRRIYNVLCKNDMEEVKATFSAIENIYDNEHLTLLLNLIFQAHYKGGNAIIKKQFEQATEEILISIENQKDLQVTSRTYIIMALLIPVGMWGLEKFNYTALGESSRTFYASPLGIGLKIILYIAALAYIGSMLLLERTT